MKPIKIKQRNYQVLALAFVVCGGVIGISFFYYMTTNSYKLNEIGDFLAGSMNAFWALAGLILVYVAFLGQKEQLMNQEEELRLSREEQKLIRLEMSAQREQLELQNSTIKKDQFENTFFKLLNYHDQNTEYWLIASYNSSYKNQVKGTYDTTDKGKKVFRTLHQKFNRNSIRKQRNELKNLGHKEHLKLMHEYIRNGLQINGKILEELHIYHLGLYNLFQFIDDSEITNKKLYSNLIVNNMPISEKIVLFYLTIISENEEKFIQLANHYTIFKGMLEYLNKSNEHFNWKLITFFNPSAFGINETVYTQFKEKNIIYNS